MRGATITTIIWRHRWRIQQKKSRPKQKELGFFSGGRSTFTQVLYLSTTLFYCVLLHILILATLSFHSTTTNINTFICVCIII